MKRLFVIILVQLTVLFITRFSFSDYQGAKTYGGGDDEGAHSIQQTADGGYIVTGYTYSFGAGSSDFWVLKLDSNGDIMWEKTYGGSGYDEAVFIQQTSDEGYIVVGYTESYGSGGDVLVLKLYNDGEIEWQKTYGGDGRDYPHSVQKTQDEGYIVASETYSFGAGNAWILKLKSDGDILWQKVYEGSGEAHSVQQTSDGGYIILSHACLLKLDSNGNVLWKECYNIFLARVIQSQDEGYIVVGFWNYYNGLLVVFKRDRYGDIAWQRNYRETFTNTASSLLYTPDGGYIMANNVYSL